MDWVSGRGHLAGPGGRRLSFGARFEVCARGSVCCVLGRLAAGRVAGIEGLAVSAGPTHGPAPCCIASKSVRSNAAQQTAESLLPDFQPSAVHSPSKWGTRDAGARRKHNCSNGRAGQWTDDQGPNLCLGSGAQGSGTRGHSGRRTQPTGNCRGPRSPKGCWRVGRGVWRMPGRRRRGAAPGGPGPFPAAPRATGQPAGVNRRPGPDPGPNPGPRVQPLRCTRPPAR